MAIALVQAGTPVTASPMTLSSASTAGNLLAAAVRCTNGTSTFPSGWLQAVSSGAVGQVTAQIWYLPGNAGGISSVAVSAGIFSYGQLLEFSGADTSSPLDQTGIVTTGSASPVSITSGNLTTNDELALSLLYLNWASATKASVSAGSGFTQAGQINNAAKATIHVGVDYELDTGASSSGTAITDAMTVSATGWATINGVIATFTLPRSGGAALPPELVMAPMTGV